MDSSEKANGCKRFQSSKQAATVPVLVFRWVDKREAIDWLQEAE